MTEGMRTLLLPGALAGALVVPVMLEQLVGALAGALAVPVVLVQLCSVEVPVLCSSMNSVWCVFAQVALQVEL